MVFLAARSDISNLDCIKQSSTSLRSERRNQIAQGDDTESVNSSPQMVELEVGESLLMRRTLIKVPMEKEPPQKKSLFITHANVKVTAASLSLIQVVKII